MLAIRMQRTGRKGHAMFRVVVQDARRTPTSGKVVAALGSYDPHAKTVILDKEKASFYLEHGAQPSDRVARLLKSEGVKLPDWVQLKADKERKVRNADKRRSTRPEPVPAEAEEPKVEESTTTPSEPEKPAAEEPAPEAEAPVDKIAEVEASEETSDGAVDAEAEKIVEESTVETEAIAQEASAETETKTEDPAADKK